MVCPRRLADRQVTLHGSRAALIVSVVGPYGATPPIGGVDIGAVADELAKDMHVALARGEKRVHHFS